MKKELTSMFENMTDEEFENLLKDCELDYKKVEKGKGGLFIDGKRITAEDMREISYIK